MKMSIRSFLLINLVVSQIATTILGAGIILYLSFKNAQTSMDGGLLEAAFTVQSLLRDSSSVADLHYVEEVLISLDHILFSPLYGGHYFDYGAFHFRVFDVDGNFLLGSNEIDPHYFSKAPLGFSQVTLHNQVWRVFSTIDPETHLKIVLSQERGLYNILPEHIVREIIYIMVLSCPSLALLMWIIVTRGLNVLERVSQQVQKQVPERFSHIDVSNLPTEIKPIVEEWNKLFDRLKLAFEREKRFAADAAHELKTPLAALKTHTQLGLNAKSHDELITALHKIVVGVNRSAHVVKQLLILNQMSQGGIKDPTTPVNLVFQAKEVIAEIFPQAMEKNTEIELVASEETMMIEGHATAINILMRNLIDNAIRYSPENSLVQVILEAPEGDSHILLKVIDNGPGIPVHLRQRVFERFFRIIGTKSSGSGLGLGIVQQIVELHNGTISLAVSPGGDGLQVIVSFPKKQ